MREVWKKTAEPDRILRTIVKVVGGTLMRKAKTKRQSDKQSER